MDYYAVVGVSRNATDEQIRDAYRRNARRLHPDRNPDSEAAERFKELTAAYEVLKDPQRRAEYDLQTSIDDSPSVSNSRDTPTSSRNASAEPFGTNKPYDRIDQALLVNGRKAVSDLYHSMESHRRGSMSASVYEVAAEMLDKSFNDFETVLRSPTFETHKPVVIQAAEDFLHNSAPGDYIAPARSSEHLASGSLGMVGLSRVAQVVGSDASPRAKEAAARSIMFAIATALLEEGLIGSCDGTDDPALSAASYEAAKLGALAELEAAASAGNSMVRIRG